MYILDIIIVEKNVNLYNLIYSLYFYFKKVTIINSLYNKY